MATALRGKRKAASEPQTEACTCPICMERTENDRFCFPCGHWICAPCDSRMLANGFLACPTCRTPREGVSQGQVDAANNERVERHAAQDGGRSLVLRSGNREVRVLFFPDESQGANPFGVLEAAPAAPARDAGAEDRLLAQAVEAASALESALPHLNALIDPLLQLDEPMQELVQQLLEPGTVQGFLAQREAVRGRGRRRRRGARLRTTRTASL